MKREILAMAVVGGLALGAGGCAKREMVKAEQPSAPSAPSATAATAAKAAPQVQSTAPAPTKVEPSPAKAEPLPASATELAAEAKELSSSLQKIFFNFDSAALSRETREKLVKDADFMKKDPDVRIQIEGHCDERGSDEYNLALGEKRARAAMQYLAGLGIPADRLSVISYGKEKPADPGHNEAAWAKNRRDEFVVPQ